MHVEDLDGRARLINKNKWAADVTVLVVDDGGLPVQNATVQGRWSTGIDGSAITDSEGLVTVTTGTISRSVDRAMFTVVGITHTSLNYVPGLNTDPDFPLDSTGTAIVVFQNGTVIPPARRTCWRCHRSIRLSPPRV